MSLEQQVSPPVVLSHSVVADAIRVMRMQESDAIQFRAAIRTVSRALAYEATRDLPVERVEIETPLERMQAARLAGCTVAVPILRAGLWMLDGVLDIIPASAAGFIGLKRNEETLVPYEYYRKVPSLDGAHLFLLDPMLATGGSITAALRGLPLESAASVSVLTIISSPEGIDAVTTAFPAARLYTGVVDRCLSDIGYILPGLGDAGDRLCGTV
ncbi:MAG TPA: uracil phosphoribosyltransferase [Candidatus Kapabacteria bacterium]|nr:uracil phosphoribosyltransferase [Candidatus Kapabacteria bacterium]